MKQEHFSPLSLIAIFAGIVEASALASLPFLSESSQGTYTWFLVGFPFFLTVLFFLTLNFNTKALFSPQASNIDAPLPVSDSAPESAAAPTTPANQEASGMLIALSGAQSTTALEQHILRIIRQPQAQAQRWVLYDLERRSCIEISKTPLVDATEHPFGGPGA